MEKFKDDSRKYVSITDHVLLGRGVGKGDQSLTREEIQRVIIFSPPKLPAAADGREQFSLVVDDARRRLYSSSGRRLAEASKRRRSLSLADWAHLRFRPKEFLYCK
ncbi:hypothetical protein Salat_1481900 [Sesamum alatum]|uniref:Uncharacterized protein n=1 Tax=Sesamum alatum TaxID=300844 RepID=A0AAE2CM11_9LAMI|nr:hypothetical protein Salat_1481900 [Sesamum alatum]